MPRLNNPTEYDLFAERIHQIVPARESVEIADEDAEFYKGNAIFTVTDLATDTDDAGDAPAKRKYVKRGSAVAEVAAAPVMETRG